MLELLHQFEELLALRRQIQQARQRRPLSWLEWEVLEISLGISLEIARQFRDKLGRDGSAAARQYISSYGGPDWARELFGVEEDPE